MTIEKVSQEEMLAQFQERLQNIVSENQKENEVTAFKLQGAIETLQYYGAGGEEETMSNPPEEESEE